MKGKVENTRWPHSRSRAAGRVGGTTALLLALGASPAAAQQVQRLDAPLAESREPFSDISGLRELSDGTLLVADGLEALLVRVSADLGTRTPLGREGSGPTEHRAPDALYAMAGDSTLMVDLGNGRLAVLAPDGAIVRTIPIAREGGSRLTLMLPGAVDAVGGVYFRGMGKPGPGGPPDSAAVSRFDPARGQVLEIANVKLPSMNVTSSGGANNRENVMTPVPLSPQDTWTATPDGRPGNNESADGAYWLEMYGDGAVLRGPRIGYDPLPVRRADKAEWIASLAGSLSVNVEMENGEVRTSFGRSRGTPALDPGDLAWPDTKPAFPAAALRRAGDGNFWLQRYSAAGDPPRFDVLDAAGNRIGVVLLPVGRRLVGFGKGTVYTARSDELEFSWLERYQLPAL